METVPHSCTSYDAHLVYFPNDPITTQQKQQGAILLHIFYLLYLFIGLGILIHHYLRPLLIHVSIHLSPIDHLTRTSMSYLTSIPIMLCITFSILTANHDVGIGIIMGSIILDYTWLYVVMIIFIPGMTASWWRITRDTMSTSATLLLFAILSADGILHWWKGLILIFWCMIYGVLLTFNPMIWDYVRIWKIRDIIDHTQRNQLARFITSSAFIIIMSIIVLIHVIFVIWQLSSPQDWHLSATRLLSWLYIIEFALTTWSKGLASYWSHPSHAFDGMIVCIILYEFLFGIRHVVGTLRLPKTIIMIICGHRHVPSQHTRLHNDMGMIFPSLELSEIPSEDHTPQHTSTSHIKSINNEPHEPSASHDEPSISHDMQPISVSASPDTSHRYIQSHTYHQVEMKDEHEPIHVTEHETIHVTSALADPISTVTVHECSAASHDQDDQRHSVSTPMMTTHPSDDTIEERWSVVPIRYYTWRIPVAIVTVITLSCLCILVMIINIKNAITNNMKIVIPSNGTLPINGTTLTPIVSP